MILKHTFIYLFCLILFCSSFISDKPLPNPSSFGQKLVEIIKQDNQKAYIEAFSLSKEEWLEYYNLAKQSPYLSDDDKSKMTLKRLDYVMSNWNADLKYNFKKIKLWIILDSIDVHKIEYLDIDYKLILDKKDYPNHQLIESYTLIKHEDQLYRIRFFNVEYINNRWVYGTISDIEKVDPYLKPINDTATQNSNSYNNYLVRSNPPNPIAISRKDSVKVLKLQKKIDAIYKKIE